MSPVLEAFGNASTHRNRNSSRFGRFVKLRMASEGPEGAALALSGGALETYLLEKSRVVRQGLGERNFHAFHMLLESRPDLLVGGNHQHRCMPPRDQELAATAGDDKSVPVFPAVARALNAVGFDDGERDAAFSVLAAIAALADAKIGASEDAASREKVATVDGGGGTPLARAAALVKVDAATLGNILTERTVTTREESLKVRRSPEDAGAARDAACRWIYGALFDALVARCNRALDLDGTASKSEARFVGILDIFGFETLQVNGLETLLINYANESLQQLFCDAVFRAELVLYEAEGIFSEDDAAALAPPDSTATLEFLAGKGPPPGILRLLDAQCATGGTTAGASSDKRDGTFLNEVARAHGTNKSLAKTRAQDRRFMFHVQHYAGKAGYTVIREDGADGWVVTNLDAIPDGLADAVAGSPDALVASLADFAAKAPAADARRRSAARPCGRARPR